MANNGVSLEIEGNTFLSVGVGVTVGGSQAVVNVLDNTFVGETGASNFAGINFAQGGGGGASANTISDFDCGIRIDGAAGIVLIGTNDFSVPPANDEDICDSRT